MNMYCGNYLLQNAAINTDLVCFHKKIALKTFKTNSLDYTALNKRPNENWI